MAAQLEAPTIHHNKHGDTSSVTMEISCKLLEENGSRHKYDIGRSLKTCKRDDKPSKRKRPLKKESKRGAEAPEKTCSESDELFYLDQFEEELKRYLAAEKVTYYSITYNPRNFREITIDGYNVERLEKQLEGMCQSKPQYTLFNIKTNNIAIVHQENGEPNVHEWTTFYQSRQCNLAKGDGTHQSVIELILGGYDKRRQRDVWDIFGVTTAHSIMDERQCLELACSGKEWERIYNEIRERCWKEKHFMAVEGEQPIDIVGQPMPVFRYFFDPERQREQMKVNDVVVFKLDKEQLKTDGFLANDECQSAQYGRVKFSAMSREEICEIYHKDTKKDLDKLIKRKVMCRGKKGVIVKPPVVVDNRQEFGLHVCFALDESEHALVRGDCGSLVYLLGEEQNQKSFILGMFFGVFKRHPDICQAVIVSASLQQIENTEEFEIEKLWPLQSKPPARKKRIDSGYASSRSTPCISLAKHK